MRLGSTITKTPTVVALSMAMYACATTLIVCAFSIYAIINNREYSWHRQVCHRVLTPEASGIVVSPEEFFYRPKGCWPASESDLEAVDRQWRRIFGIPVWILLAAEQCGKRHRLSHSGELDIAACSIRSAAHMAWRS